MSKTKKANLDAVFAPIPGNLLKESINLAIGSGYCILYTPASNFPNIVSIILGKKVTHWLIKGRISTSGAHILSKKYHA
jgi:hypothetical protein